MQVAFGLQVMCSGRLRTLSKAQDMLEGRRNPAENPEVAASLYLTGYVNFDIELEAQWPHLEEYHYAQILLQQT